MSKKQLRVHATTWLCLLVASCASQEDHRLPDGDAGRAAITSAGGSGSSAGGSGARSPDFDPYFVESTVITSSRGPSSITRNILEDSSGNLWFASWEGLIRYDGETFTNFTNRDGLRRHRFFSLLEDRAGGLWFGTMGAGVYRYDGESFSNLTTQDGLVGDHVGCILEDAAGMIWFGTMSGISRFDGKTFRSFTSADGLADDDVNAIAEDGDGNLWIGTRGEASLYDGERFTTIERPDGRRFSNVRSIAIDRDGGIWLGGNDGLWRFDGRSYTQYSTDFVGYVFEDAGGSIWTSAGAPGTGNMVLCRYDPEPAPFGLRGFVEVHREDGQVFGIFEDSQRRIWFGTERGVIRFDDPHFRTF